jgi:hypothetical protein
MKILKTGILAIGAVALGGTFFVSSTFAGTNSRPVLEVIRHNSGSNVSQRQTVSATTYNETERRVLLVPPPAELPMAPSSRMVTSIAPVAPVAAPQQQTVKVAVKEVAAPAKAAKVKPENLFSYVRLLNYAPHPLTEEFLKKAPLAYNGHNSWFAVKYHEDWNVVGDEEGYIKGLSFEIDIMENDAKVRTLKTPKVAIDKKSLKKGMVLGIAEVAPYKFTISVEEFTKNKKGVSELIFKLDLIG